MIGDFTSSTVLAAKGFDVLGGASYPTPDFAHPVDLPAVGGGLALATEIMIGTPAIRAMIRDGRAHQIYATIQAGQQVGMRTMNSSLAGLVRLRKVTREDAEARSPDVKELRQLLAS